MRSVWRPERRNRNIGTAAAGHSKLNDMRIPEAWRDRNGSCSRFYERLDVVSKQRFAIEDFELTVLYEQPAEGCTYGCTPLDVVNLLSLVTTFTASLPEIIAFRQPTKKQRLLNPVWGRFIYFADFGALRGAAIILEAQELGARLDWPRRMSLLDRYEFDRLIEDGHEFKAGKRNFQARLAEKPVRNTMLFRTVPHELGHWDQYYREVLDDSTALDENPELASELYFSKPTSEREIYADAFAVKLRQGLISKGMMLVEYVK